MNNTSGSAHESILQVEKLTVHYPVTEGTIFRKQVGSIHAVDGVSFELKRGETYGLVGESGCGKSTTASAILRMQDVTSGKILFEGEDITHFNGNQLKPIRRRIQMVYQDPFGSLNPRMKIRDIIGEPLVINGIQGTRSELRNRVDGLMELVGLLSDMANRYPHELSGGQRQRIGIARALALEPSLVVCDEAVSALDVSIQAQVLNLFQDLQEQLGLTYLFIAHDLSVVRHICDRIAVMYLGRIVEIANRDELFRNPKHPYTEALMAAVPVPDPEIEAKRMQQIIEGEVPSPRNPPSGCRFHPRCPRAIDTCGKIDPKLGVIDATRAVACHLEDGH